MTRNMFLIAGLALFGMALLIPLKASTVFEDQGRVEDDNTDFCDKACDGGGEGTTHQLGTGNDNANCDECATVIWDKCEEFLNHDSICVEVGTHTEEGCPNYTPDPNSTVYNEDARQTT